MGDRQPLTSSSNPDGRQTIQLLTHRDGIGAHCTVQGCSKTNREESVTGEVDPIIRIKTKAGSGTTFWLDLCWEHFEDMLLDGIVFLRDIRRMDEAGRI
jgi:hypothetical protein